MLSDNLTAEQQPLAPVWELAYVLPSYVQSVLQRLGRCAERVQGDSPKSDGNVGALDPLLYQALQVLCTDSDALPCFVLRYIQRVGARVERPEGRSYGALYVPVLVNPSPDVITGPQPAGALLVAQDLGQMAFRFFSAGVRTKWCYTS